MYSGLFVLLMNKDVMYMDRAIRLAENGKGFVNPNPMVGAVIVKGERIIGEGWHEYRGGLHAERNAFKNCLEDAVGATLYVTLEPCCHHGKTPPCTEAVIEHGISRVVIGLMDPNPLVAGKGIEKLKAAGIEVVSGVAEDRIRELNKVFLKYITTGLPWVVMKTAMTLDGKIASCTGDSRWVTGEGARRRVQGMRAENMGIMVGIGTVMMDNPLLNCRLEGDVRQPVRVIVDSRARIGADSNIVKTADVYRTIVAYTAEAEDGKIERLKSAGVEVLLCEEKEGRTSVAYLLKQLGDRGIDSILLEGGGELNYSFLCEGFVDEVYAFIAPKLIGGEKAKTPVEGKGRERMADAVELLNPVVEKVGEDFLIRGRVKNSMDAEFYNLNIR